MREWLLYLFTIRCKICGRRFVIFAGHNCGDAVWTGKAA